MRVETTWIHSADETPRLGSGTRVVRATIGRKWARLECHCRASVSDLVTVETYKRIKREDVK